MGACLAKAGASSSVRQTESSNSFAKNAVFDVLVVGGGFTGISCLRALRAAGYNATLVTAGVIGEGQSLKCHGWLHRGYLPSLVAPPLAKQWWEMTKTFEASNLKGNDEEVIYTVPTPVFESTAKPTMEKNGMPYEVITSDDDLTSFRSNDLIFDKKKWLSAMVSELEGSIGMKMPTTCLEYEGSTWAATCGDELVRAKYVCVAAGTGIMTVLQSIAPQLEADVIKLHHWVRPISMFCVRAPKELLGTSSALVIRPPLPPTMIACNSTGVEKCVLYCTPYAGAPKPGESPNHALWDTYSTMPWNGSADWRNGMKPDPTYATACMKVLFAHRPELRDAVEQLEFGFYGGMKQDAGWPSKPMLYHLQEPSGSQNLVVANTQFVGMCHALAAELVGKVKDAIGDPSPLQLSPWAANGDLLIGEPDEMVEHFEWMSFEEYKLKFAVVI